MRSVKKYYELPIRNRQKQRKKMMRLLKKNGYGNEDLIRIVDGLSGMTIPGKEKTAREITRLVTEGADKEAVFSLLRQYEEARFIDIQ